MQDSTPRFSDPRGRLRPPSRPMSFGRARSIEGFYTRRTRITSESIEITETFIAEPAPMTRPIEHLSSEEKVEVLQRALARAQVELRAEHRSRRGLRRLTLTKVL